MNLSKYEKALCVRSMSKLSLILRTFSVTGSVASLFLILCFLCKSKKVSYGSFYKDEWFLDSSDSVHFTLFESDFVNITLGNYN